MGYPEITEDQREMAVELLANAMRKDAHLRAHAHQVREGDSPLVAGMMRRRGEPSRRYVEGMRDLLRALFPNGHIVADECLEEASIRASGAHVPKGGNGTQDR